MGLRVSSCSSHLFCPLDFRCFNAILYDVIVCSERTPFVPGEAGKLVLLERGEERFQVGPLFLELRCGLGGELLPLGPVLDDAGHHLGVRGSAIPVAP